MLLDLLKHQELKSGSGIPPEIKSRIERLFAAPGKGSDQTVCIVAYRFSELDYVDPEWVRGKVVPWFNLEDPASEPAWNGFLYTNYLLEPEMFSLIKHQFLNMFEHASWKGRWNGELLQRRHDILVHACFRHLNNNTYITFGEARCSLQQTDDEGRAHSLWCLSRIVDKNQAWKRFGKPFLEKAWPREARFQTELTSQQFARLVIEAGDLFPEVVQAIHSLFGPDLSGRIALQTSKAERRGRI